MVRDACPVTDSAVGVVVVPVQGDRRGIARWPANGSIGPATEEGAGEVAAKAERELEGGLEGRGARLTRGVVERTVGVGVGEVDGGGDNTVAKGQDESGEFDTPRRSQQVPERSLEAGARNLAGVGTKRPEQRGGLERIIAAGGGAVVADAVDFVGSDTRPGEGVPNHTGKLSGVGIQLHQVRGLGTRSTRQPGGEGRDTPRAGVGDPFEHQDRGSLSHHKPAPVAIEGADRPGGIAVRGGQHPQAAKGGLHQFDQRGVGTAGEGDIAPPRGNQVGGPVHAEKSRGTGRDGAQQRASQAQSSGDPGAGSRGEKVPRPVPRRGRGEEWCRGGMHFAKEMLQRLPAPLGSSQHAGDAVRIGGGGVEPGMEPRLPGSPPREVEQGLASANRQGLANASRPGLASPSRQGLT